MEKTLRKPGKTRFLERYNGLKLGWLHDSLHFILLTAALFLLFRFCIGLSVVGGDSMDPTLKDGTVVVYNRLVRNYKAGDVISLRVPSGEYYVKRIIAVAGDTVDLRDGFVYVNGNRIEEDQPYGETLEEAGSIIYPYTVRKGSVFVLGDNRLVSLDSRTFGEVGLRQIKGRIFLAIGRDGVRVQ